MNSFARRNVITLLLILLVVAVGILLVPHIGPAWDEPDNIQSAGRYIEFFQKGFNPKILFNPDWTVSYYGDKIYTQDPSMYRYPPVPNYVGAGITLIGAALGIRMTPSNIFISFHLATVLFLALLVATVYRIAKLLGLKTWTSVFAALVTFLYPTLFGHGLSNLKDTAQVALFTLSLYLLVKGSWEHIRHDIVLGAVVWGLALATKINAIFVPIIWGIWVECQMLNLPAGEAGAKWPINKHIVHIFRFIIGHLSLVIAIGLATTFVVWPVLWFHPVTSALTVIKYFTTVGQWYMIYWNGVQYHAGSGQLLWWYPWANLLFETPILLLFFIFIGIIRVVVAQKHATQKKALLAVVIMWLCIPILRTFDPYIVFYDGIRHFMEVLPAWIILGAIGLETLWTARTKWLFSLVGVVIIGNLILINRTYFPYSTGYYNMLAQNPNKNFDRDIEALTIKEGIDYIHAHYSNVRLWLHDGGHLSWYWLTPNDTYVYSIGEGDTTILINKGSHMTKEDFDASPNVKGKLVPVYTITRGNAIFAWVYRRI